MDNLFCSNAVFGILFCIILKQIALAELCVILHFVGCRYSRDKSHVVTHNLLLSIEFIRKRDLCAVMCRDRVIQRLVMTSCETPRPRQQYRNLLLTHHRRVNLAIPEWVAMQSGWLKCVCSHILAIACLVELLRNHIPIVPAILSITAAIGIV